MVRLIEGAWLAKALHVVVTLRIADQLRDGPRTSEDLAAATGTRAPFLHRVLRALAVEGVFAVDDRQRFSLTPVGATLRSDVPGSLHDWARLMLGPVHQAAWSDVGHAVRTGESAFQHHFGADLWEYRRAHPDYAALFDAAMAGFTMTYVERLLEAYSFASFTTIVDVGGGDGSLLISILQQHPHAHGILCELPAAAARAAQRIDEADLATRCTTCGGDAFQQVPAGGDAYLLSRVLHDWDDEHARTLLDNCRKVLPATGRVLVIERIIPDRTEPGGRDAVVSDIHMTDLNMMVMTSGRERTLTEYRGLFDRAGLALVRVVPTRTAMNVMELRHGSLE
jgi:hypothetical protein